MQAKPKSKTEQKNKPIGKLGKRNPEKKGASQAHKISKRMGIWSATIVQTPKGPTAAPKDLLEAQATKWRKVWETEAIEKEVVCPKIPNPVPKRGTQGVARLSATQIREAAKTFSLTTAGQTDGWKMRHFTLLSDKSLEALAWLFRLTDTTGLIPQQLCRIILPMIPKKTTGFRLIGLYSAYYRLWACCRAPLAAAWEETNKNHGWGHAEEIPTRHRLASRSSRGSGSRKTSRCPGGQLRHCKLLRGH